jgi:hypothetical protein
MPDGGRVAEWLSYWKSRSRSPCQPDPRDGMAGRNGSHSLLGQSDPAGMRTRECGSDEPCVVCQYRYFGPSLARPDLIVMVR